MASEQQLALTRRHRNTAANLPRAARQIVPAFLQKLYEMVSDVANDALIKWSDTGDSFFVLDHERFAREVLGRWFKHQNFNSFVRQLNMYGFRKIPHLQQGVLRSSPDTEFWNFEHQNFRRGQPDLLCLIQRKKQATERGDDVLEATNPPYAAQHIPAPATSATLSAGQLLDINSIVNGITAIKRHQTTISAELNALKDSNQHLWQEAIAARERHKKHQDTINRILKFLAGVFGHSSASGTPVHHDKENDDNDDLRPVMARNSHRLMIGGLYGGEREGIGKGMDLLEVMDEDSPNFRRSTSPPDRFVTVDTPKANESPTIPPATIPPMTAESNAYLPPTAPPISHPSPTSFPPSELTSHAQQPAEPPLRDASSSALTTTTPPRSPDPATVLQSTFSQVMNSPDQLQRLLAALGSSQAHPGYPIPNPHPPPTDSAQQLTTLAPQYDFSSAAPLLSGHDEDASSLAHFDPLLQNTQTLQRAYKDSSEIENDVNSLDVSINSLIQSMGIDPNAVSEESHPSDQHTNGNGLDHLEINPSAAGMDVGMDATTGNDFDFDEFLSEIAHNGDEYTNYEGFTDRLTRDNAASAADSPSQHSPKEQFTAAFLNEVDSPSDGAASPVGIFQHDSPAPTMPRGKKRKSGMAGIVEGGGVTKSKTTTTNNSPGVRARRKK